MYPCVQDYSLQLVCEHLKVHHLALHDGFVVCPDQVVASRLHIPAINDGLLAFILLIRHERLACLIVCQSKVQSVGRGLCVEAPPDCRCPLDVHLDDDILARRKDLRQPSTEEEGSWARTTVSSTAAHALG